MTKFTMIVGCIFLGVSAGAYSSNEAVHQSSCSQNDDFFGTIKAYFCTWLCGEPQKASSCMIADKEPLYTKSEIVSSPDTQALEQAPYGVKKVLFFDSMRWNMKKNKNIIKKYFLDKCRFTRKSFATLNTLKKLYDKNDFSQKVVPQKQIIPKIVHQIWVGPGVPPAVFRKSQNSIRKYLAEWEYKLWTDNDIAALGLFNQKFYDRSKNYGEKADLVRYELLYRYGGVCVDVDCVLLKSLDKLLTYDMWTAIQPLDYLSGITTSIIGSVPGHPVLKDCIETVQEDWSRSTDILGSAGQRHFQRSFMKFINDTSMNNIAFPASYFYPLDFKDRLLVLGENGERDFKKVRSFIKRESFALHYWACSFGICG
ncbi:hypothetical protein H0X06_00415 [Candidatus Dependentiae bacterium]|nr:hypothetical protein [Candidatus Dependentiae bacterium]